MSGETPLAKEKSDLQQTGELDKAEKFLAEAQAHVQKGAYGTGIDKLICALRTVQSDGNSWVYIGQHLMALWIEIISHSKVHNPELYDLLNDHDSSFLDTVALLEAPRAVPTKNKAGRLKVNFVPNDTTTKIEHEIQGVPNPITEVYERLTLIREVV
jgi:hypothetical protein